MNFTREPIIETIITPKDGFKLTLRSSKVSSAEEYSCEAVEVVSFGNAQFFRSTEKPKAFLLPIADYEVVEIREAKIVLKNPIIERPIKIAGGKEHPAKHVSKELIAATEGSDQIIEESESGKESTFEKRKDKKKNRRKKGPDLRHQEKEQDPKGENRLESSLESSVEAPAESVSTVSLFSSLLPPPTTLISETIARYKAIEALESPAQTKESDSVEIISEESSQDDLDQIWKRQEDETFLLQEERSLEPELAIESQEELSKEEPLENTENSIE